MWPLRVSCEVGTLFGEQVERHHSLLMTPFSFSVKVSVIS
jgi:hypothetical protein